VTRPQASDTPHLYAELGAFDMITSPIAPTELEAPGPIEMPAPLSEDSLGPTDRADPTSSLGDNTPPQVVHNVTPPKPITHRRDTLPLHPVRIVAPPESSSPRKDIPPPHVLHDVSPLEPNARQRDTSPPQVNHGTASPTMNRHAPSPQVKVCCHEYMRIGGPTAILRSNTVPAASAHLSLVYQRDLAHTDDAFRVLRIEGGRSGSLRCHLEDHNLSDRTAYEAMSYCWGTQDADCAISGGMLAGVRVSEHLLQALMRLRLPSSDRLVWIDALCVNQHNNQERTHQLNLIPRIYENAVRTIIWIGDFRTSEQCERGFTAGKDSVNTLCVPSIYPATEHEKADDDLSMYLSQLQGRDISAGCSDVWWQRLWCIQELYFSRQDASVYIGPHAVPWDKFYSLFGSDIYPLRTFRDLKDKLPKSLRDLFVLTSTFNASDPRDRVFALLGMAPERSAAFQALDPDYDSSVIRVIEDAAVYLIKETGRLDVLLDERVDRTRWGKEGLVSVVPTWIPDLTSLLSENHWPKQYEDAGQARTHGPHFWLSERTTLDAIYDAPRMLSFEGLEFDVIDKRTESTRGAPGVERSPNSCFIYNSLKERGHVVEWILEQLDYNFEDHESFAKIRHHGLEPVSKIGLLMLTYLLEGVHEPPEEYLKRSKAPEVDLSELYNRQRQEDLAYIRDVERRSGDDLTQDRGYVDERWHLKIDRAQGEQPHFTPSRLEPALRSEWETVIMKDYEIARNLGNLFIYARGSRDRYYLNAANTEAPMRKDVLGCATIEQVKMLPTQIVSQGAGIEIHNYNAKSREMDFFKTRTQWLGLGPSCLEVGDQIVVPLGASRPLILREDKVSSTSKDKIFTLIGEACVPSISSGKWMRLRQGRSNLKTYQVR